MGCSGRGAATAGGAGDRSLASCRRVFWVGRLVVRPRLDAGSISYGEEITCGGLQSANERCALKGRPGVRAIAGQGMCLGIGDA